MIKKQREKQYAVFGLGRFGTSVALTLNELGYQVMGVDTSFSRAEESNQYTKK